MLPPIPSPDAHDCPNCGALINEVTLKRCPQCGAALKQSSHLSPFRIVGLLALVIGSFVSIGVGACSLTVINGKGELPELGWIGFWPAVIALLLCLFGIIGILKKR